MDAGSHINRPKGSAGGKSRRKGAKRGASSNNSADRRTGSSSVSQSLDVATKPIHPYDLEALTARDLHSYLSHILLTRLQGSGVILTTGTGRRLEGTLAGTATDAGGWGAALENVRDLGSPSLGLRKRVSVDFGDIATCVPQQSQSTQQSPPQSQSISNFDGLTFKTNSSPAVSAPFPTLANSDNTLRPASTASTATTVGGPPAEASRPDAPQIAISGTEYLAKSSENGPVVGSFLEFAIREKQRLAQRKQAIIKSENEKRMAELVAFSQNYKLNKPIPKDLLPILTKDTEKAKRIVEKSSQDAKSPRARRIGGTSSPSTQLLKKPAVSVNPNPSSAMTSRVSKMVIQPIPPFNPKKAKGADLLAVSETEGVKALPVSEQPKDVVEPTTLPNQFYDTGVLKAFQKNLLADEFKLSRPAELTELLLIEPQWPYTGRASMITFPSSPSSRPDPAPESPGSLSTQPVDYPIDPTAPVVYPTLTAPVEPVAQRDEIQSQKGSGNSLNLEHVLSSTMSVEQIIALLCQHGYPDITTQLNLKECGKYPRVHGGAADIYCGRLHNGSKVAIKRSRVRILNDENGQACLRALAKEGYFWSKYRHSNVLETYGVVQFQGGIALVAPWMENGTVMDYIRVRTDADRPKLCMGIACGLAYLHQVESTHGDLKGANVLVSHDGVVKLNDFGSTSMKQHTLKFTGGTHSRNYTLRWAAPEILSEDGDITAAADVYALGMTILEIITGKQPFEYLRREESVTAALFGGKTPRRPEKHIPPTSTQGDGLWDLLQLCWKKDPQRRPSAQGAVDVLSQITPEGLRA